MLLNIILYGIDTSNFWIVNWYYITGIILSFTGVFFGIKNYYKKNRSNIVIPNNESTTKINPKIQSTINPTNTINVNVNTEKEIGIENKISQIDNDRENIIDSLKSKIQILFIDDDSKFNVVKILKDSGWKKTYSVIDIKSVDIPIVKESNIYFVDINGVGKLLGCEYEGLDLALMLKQKYPNKKVVIYSANKKNNAFHQAWDLCDYKLEKNALPYQFQGLVEQYSIELFS